MSEDSTKKRARELEALLVSGAGEVARTSDRWFVQAIGDVAGAGRWARREASVIGDSMSAAFDTTVQVAKKMTGGPPAPREEAPRRSPKIDVLTATDDDLGAPPQVSESELAHPAGISPLLAALEAVVSSRKDEGYASLRADARFWALVELIHEHREGGGDEEGS